MLNKAEAGPGTVIGANVKLVGALKDVNDITVHGTIEGEVGSERTVTIGETAVVKGPVSGATVSVAGTVRGSIEAAERLELLPTGKVYGNITTKDLVVRSGATFVGKSAMSDEQKEKAPEPDEPQEKLKDEKKEYEVE